MKKHPDPLEIDRDNRDKSPQALQRKAFRLCSMTNQPGHGRDKPGHSFAGRVTTAHFSARPWNSGRLFALRAFTQRGKIRANDYLPRPLQRTVSIIRIYRGAMSVVNEC
jgi:hypothetical protein